MLALQLCFTYVPIMNRLFHTAPIDLWWWGAMSGIGFGVFALAELKKAIGERPEALAAPPPPPAVREPGGARRVHEVETGA